MNSNFPSVYIFYGEGGEPLYVGSSRRMPARLREHTDSAFWPLVDRVEIRVFDDFSAALEVERDLISKYAPPFNVELHDGSVVSAAERREMRDVAHMRGELCGWHNCRTCAQAAEAMTA
jgi:excinuclease UvrABC nuclease subunit